MKMNKYAVLVLIFFLIFSFYLRQVRANAATSGGSESDGYDMSGYYQNGQGTIPVQAPEEIVSQVSNQAAQFSIQFLAMAFQLFGIVVLGILLIVIVEELIKSNA